MEGSTVRASNIKSAINKVNYGAKQRQAAALHGLSQSTLHGRLHGATSKLESKLQSAR